MTEYQMVFVKLGVHVTSVLIMIVTEHEKYLRNLCVHLLDFLNFFT